MNTQRTSGGSVTEELPKHRFELIGKDGGQSGISRSLADFRLTGNLTKSTGLWIMNETEGSRGMQWQPIETAPKDGSNIILGCPTYVDAGYWDCDGWCLYPDDSRPPDYVIRFHPEPTHWMPLPEPPTN